MISLGKIRHIRLWIGPWLLGLYLIAQIAGITPLYGVHFQHVLANQQDIADDLSNSIAHHHIHVHHTHGADGGRGEDFHDHSTTDPNDQCCTLHHHLAGVLPFADGTGTICTLIPSIVSLPQRSVAGADPGLPERPPKLLLSI